MERRRLDMRRGFKRLIDIVASALGLALLSPLMGCRGTRDPAEHGVAGALPASAAGLPREAVRDW